MGKVIQIKLSGTGFQHLFIPQLYVILALFRQNGFKFCFIVVAFDCADEVSSYFVCRFLQQMVIDKCTYRFTRHFQQGFRTFFPQSPVIFVRGTERTFHIAFFIGLQSRTIFLIFSCHDKLFHFPHPIIKRDFTTTAINPSILQMDIIPRIIAFPTISGFYTYNL